MCQLDSGDGSSFLDEVGHFFQCGDVFIFPDAQAIGRDAASRFDAGCLGDEQSDPADGASAVMGKVPVIGKAIDAGVLAHG